MSARDTLVQLGFMMIAFGAALGTWALLTGPLGKITRLGPRAKRSPVRRKTVEATPEPPALSPEDDPGT